MQGRAEAGEDTEPAELKYQSCTGERKGGMRGREERRGEEGGERKGRARFQKQKCPQELHCFHLEYLFQYVYIVLCVFDNISNAYLNM